MPRDANLIERAKTMRREPTPLERKLWLAIRAGRLGGAKFRRQQVIGNYIADFACRLPAMLVVEVDGDTHAEQPAYDARRTQALEARGYRVLRFSNRDVSVNLEGVLMTISATLSLPLSPALSPEGGEGEGNAMLTLTDDQRMLHDTVGPFMADEGAIKAQLRHWRDIGCKDGFGHGLWKQFAELGLTGILIPEAQGGAGLGQVEAGIVLEEIGRNLTPSPFLTTAVAAVRALEGSAQAERWFPGIVAGETVAALAIDEGRRHDPAGIALEAKRSGNGFSLSGAKQFVVQGASADVILVAARTSGTPGETQGVTLFAIERDTKGLEIDNVALADSSKAAQLTLTNVEIDAEAVVGEVDGGWAHLSRALSAGRAGAAAELIGVAAGASDMTLDYLKQRKQFGRLIGEYQVLQHRAAHLFGEIEIARAAALKAAQLLDAGDERAKLMVSVAKAKAARSATLAVQEGVQMHGGIGMTDEHDIGLYMKREAVLSELFGGPRYHAAKVAELSGY